MVEHDNWLRCFRNQLVSSNLVTAEGATLYIFKNAWIRQIRKTPICSSDGMRGRPSTAQPPCPIRHLCKDTGRGSKDGDATLSQVFQGFTHWLRVVPTGTAPGARCEMYRPCWLIFLSLMLWWLLLISSGATYLSYNRVGQSSRCIA